VLGRLLEGAIGLALHRSNVNTVRLGSDEVVTDLVAHKFPDFYSSGTEFENRGNLFVGLAFGQQFYHRPFPLAWNTLIVFVSPDGSRVLVSVLLEFNSWSPGKREPGGNA